LVSCEIGASCGCGFKNTGADYSKVWDKIHDLIKKEVDCEECQDHGLLQVSGLRDHVKAGIGGEVFNKKIYRDFVKEVNCVFQKCSVDGRC